MELPDCEERFLNLRFLDDGEGKTKKSFLVDNLLKQIKTREISFNSHGGIFIYATENFILTLKKSRANYSGRHGESVYNYILTIGNNNGLLTEFSDNDHDYNDWARRRPIMELYDVVVLGRCRSVPLMHVCGLQGFGQNMNDRCPACEEGEKK